jgi:disulfide bond formation protein DsbB
MTNFIKQLLPILTLVGGVIIVLSLLLFIASKFSTTAKKLLDEKVIPFLSKNSIVVSLIVASTATLGSLFYSDVLGYAPCKLCWYQRIFMYPQMVLFFVAYVRKETHIFAYGMILSVIGAVIAMYHYLLQINIVSEIVPCSTVGYSVSCSDNFGLQYGYITIPMMALTAFILLIGVWYVMKKSKLL